MTTLRQALLALALLGALALLLWGQYQREQATSARTALSAQHLRNAQADAKASQAVADLLQRRLAEQNLAQASLRTTQALLRQNLADSLNQIKELEHANAELRDWAAQPLPAVARRLRKRPAITGATAYRDWLSRRNALHPASGQPEP